MADSVVAICNRALDLLGANPIASLEDDAAAARWLARNWTAARDATLAAYPWNCAMRRAVLAADAAAPAWGHARAFTLPEGPESATVPAYCLRARAVLGGWPEPGGAPWKVEGRKILTDLTAPLYVRYTARVEDPAQFDAELADALALRLAADAAVAITGNAELAKAMRDAFAGVLRAARLSDAQEDTPEDATADDWLNARL